MREDMFKVIVERPRSGRSWASKSKLRYVKGDAPRRMSGKRIASLANGGTKYLNENLAPLKRYLHKQKGRKWNDVFSEICAGLDTGSTVKMHVREHIDDFITRNVRVETAEGSAAYWAAGYWGEPMPPSQWRELYVDPHDGRIKETAAFCRKQGVPTRKEYWKAQREAYKNPGRKYPVKPLSGNGYAVQHKGIWYAVEIKGKLRGGERLAISVIWDAIDDPESREANKVRLLSKKQMPTKQLRKLGLVNALGDHYG